MINNKLVEYQHFPSEYFAGSDVYLIFNNEFADEIVEIQFSMTEQVAPIYGYASYTYDAVARGSRLINGSFRINFKESRYLYDLMGVGERSYYNPRSARKIVEDAVKKNFTYIDAEIVNSLLVSGQDDKLDDMISENQETLWGQASEAIGESTVAHKPYFTERMSNPEMKQGGFDIVISYGDRNFHPDAITQYLPGTVKVINGVQLTGVSQIVAPTGEAVLEEYTFLARDLDNTIDLRK